MGLFDQLSEEVGPVICSIFRAHVASDGKLADVMFANTQALMAQTAQSVVCNAVHDIPERCARWLLQVHDRVDGDGFELTQSTWPTCWA